jgi:hypothetical protein
MPEAFLGTFLTCCNMLHNVRTALTSIVACRVANYATISRWAGLPESFLGNGSINTFPQQQSRMQQWYSNTRAVFSMWSVARGYKIGEETMKRRLGCRCDMGASWLQECSVESPAAKTLCVISGVSNSMTVV